MRHVTRTVRRTATGKSRALSWRPPVATSEGMERRLLLAADIVLDGGNLTVTGTEGNDVMSVVRVGVDDVQVTVNALTRRFDTDDVDIYMMLGLGGDDRITKTGSVRTAESAGFAVMAGDGDDTVRGTGMVIRHAERLEDGSGRVVASRIAGSGDLVVNGTGGNDMIALSEPDGRGLTLSVNDTYFARLNPGDYGEWAVLAKGGNDTVDVGPFAPKLSVSGGAGDDVVHMDAAASSVAFDAEDGDDLLRVEGDTFGNVRYFFGGDGADTVEMTSQDRLDLNAVSTAGVYPFAEIENVTNARGTVIGNRLNNRITVAADDVTGVEVRGGDGDDTVVGAAGPDRFYGEGGHDTLTGNGGNDLLDGGPGVDSLSGGPGTNTLVNGENGKGPQFFVDANRKLNVYGTLGADTFSVVRVGVDDVRATVNGVSRTFDMDDFDRIELAGAAGNDTMTAGNGVEELVMLGGFGDDRITGNDRANQILGEAGNDTLAGGAGGDTVVGGEGNDTIDGGSGVDFLSGEAGNDTLYARDGAADFAVHGGDGAAGGFDRARVDPSDPVDGVEQFLA